MTLKPWSSKLGYKNPPPTLVVYYQDEPVAEMKKEGGKFFFRYLPAFLAEKLSPLPGLPESGAEFAELPAYFGERLPDTRRPEIRQYMLKNQIDESDELRMLALLGAGSITDSFELKLRNVALVQHYLAYRNRLP